MKISSIVSTAKKFLFPASHTKTIKVQSNVVPFSPAGGAGALKGAGTIAKGAYNALKTFATKKTINPAAGVSGTGNIIKTLAKSAGVGALAGGLFGAGKTISKAAVSGQVPTAKEAASTIGKTTAAGAGVGLSPLGGGVGIIEGTGSTVTKTAQNFYNILKGKGQSMIPENYTNPFKDIKDNLPTYPSPTINLNYTIPTGTQISDIMPTTPQAIYIETPQMSPIQTPSVGFSPSFSVGGGGGISESLPLLLLLGAGFGGYALGKRTKRKKKRYKKYKRRK